MTLCCVVGHFLLTNLLADVLVAGAPSRVVMVVGNGQKYGSIDFDDLNSEKSYSSINVAMRSKLANVLFANELARRAKGQYFLFVYLVAMYYFAAVNILQVFTV
jgi:hypothetical protein